MFDPLGLAFSLTVAGGGIYGYAKARSVSSLVAGLTFGAVLLVGSHTYSRGKPEYLLGGSAALGALMGVRYYNTRKMMPSGIITGLSVLMTLRCLYDMRRRY